MKTQKQAPEISLHIPPQMWQQFRQSILKSRTMNEEVIGFFFCKRQQISKNKIRYIPSLLIKSDTKAA
ncbi:MULTISPECIES: hypothetical protein [unclassified Nostoc]|uniref:hypothetical protein n=1 Tax=unclassified Nostoc TaxID=2593658 RepID=UPI001679BCC9|nr:hypothetical protein [Nostoc sp. 'Peltigera membranacea cyanobiont' 232]